MASERLRLVERIFHSALARAPETRAAFLDEACGGDATLRAEVASLLATDRSADALFAGARIDNDASIDETASLVGARIGDYEIGALLGAGGMGRVYRARDLRLGRDVALKILPPAVSSDPARIARFEREARVLASLSHPNIAVLFGIAGGPSIRGLVLELVEGPTVAELVAERGSAALPIDQCLRIAREIADALDAAHLAGIIHRDLKPANIKLTSAGTVKVLDFGLAKAQVQAPRSLSGGEETREGTIAGTPAYMSPEQARGGVVDRRTDIWAFGCVLYEMLTGRAAFGRATASDSLAAVLSDEPDWSALPRETPPAIVQLLRECLEKAPSARRRDLSQAWSDAGTSKARRSGRALRLAVLGGAALVGLALVASAAWLAGAFDRSVPEARFEFRIGPPAGHVPWSGVAVAPDGRRLAVGTFGSGPMIWVHDLAAATWTPVPNTELAGYPFWSPDGSSLGYFAQGRLWRTDLDGRSPTALANIVRARGGSWATDDVIVFAGDDAIFSVPAGGGAATRIPLADADKPVERWAPRWLPGGRTFLYHQRDVDGARVYAASIDGKVRTRLVDSPHPGAYAPPGYLLFVRGSALLAQRLDVGRLVLVGQPSIVAADAAPGFLSGRAAFSASDSGVLAFGRSREGTPGVLKWFDAAGQPAGTIAQPEQTEWLNPAISPDGRRVAVNRMDPQTGNWDIWTIDTLRGVQTRVTFHDATDADPVWSPDGKEIAFASDRGGVAGIYRKAADGSGQEERLLQDDRPGLVMVPTDWSRTGTIVYSHSQVAPAGWRLSLLKLADRSTSTVTEPTAFVRYAGRISPDGRWLAYSSAEGGTFEVFIRPVDGTGRKQQVSLRGGIHPRWSADGRRLFYWARPGGIMSIDLTPAGEGVQASEPRSIVAVQVAELIDGRPHYDVARDGSRFLLRQPAGAFEPPIGVIVNWRGKISK